MATFKAGSVIENVASTATAAGTTTLILSSATYQQFTGTTTQTVVLPDATTLPTAKRFYIANRSTMAIDVQYDDASAAVTVDPDTERLLVLIDNGTSNGTWDISTGSGGGGGGSTTTIMTDWVDYSAGFTVSSGFGTIAEVELWIKRVGDTAVCRGKFIAGTTSAADAFFNLPTGLTVDSSKFVNNATAGREGCHLIGIAEQASSSVNTIQNGPFDHIFWHDADQKIYITNEVDNNKSYLVRLTNGFVNTNDLVTFNFSVPILEWNNSGTDNIMVIAQENSGQSIPDVTDTVQLFSTASVDPFSNWNTGTGVFTASADGQYQIDVSTGFEVGATVAKMWIRKNGATALPIGDTWYGTNTQIPWLKAGGLVDLVNTDTLEVIVNQTSGGALNTNTTFIGGTQVSIFKVN